MRGKIAEMKQRWKHSSRLFLLLLRLTLGWQSPPEWTRAVNRRGSQLPDSSLLAQKRVLKKESGFSGDEEHRHYTITYSPNFNRHLVSCEFKEGSGASGKKTAVRSFLWLDEALRVYPNATLETMDLPPPFPSTQEQPTAAKLLLSRIVAGAGVNESSVYYDDGRTSRDLKPGSLALKNNGGSYLYRFLAKLYSAEPSVSPAEIHRGVMDRFPRIAFYDAALVHERLFFLLSPLPPRDILDKVIRTKNQPTKRSKLPVDVAGNATAAFCDDFHLLFHKNGYGAGLSKFQLAQALQSLPQYWLPIYLGDALASTRKPQDVLPYIFYDFSSNPDAFRDATKDLDHLLTGTAWADVASLAHAKSSLKLTSDQCRMLLYAFPTLRTSDTEPNWELFQRGPVRPMLMEESLVYLRIRLQLDPVQITCLIKTHTRLSSYTVNGSLKPILDALQSKLELQSKELQQVILRMPSLLGMSRSALDARITFFLLEVGLTPAQLKKSVLELPALLQYSLGNLGTKWAFFREDLHIQKRSAIARMLATKPMLWSLSVERNLRPSAESLQAFCRLSSLEIGEVLSNAPELLLFSFEGNIEPKLRFLIERLDLNPIELKGLLLSSPRILNYSLSGSLSAKIGMIEEYLSRQHELGMTAKDVLMHVPSLLLASKSRLNATLSKPEYFNARLIKLARPESDVPIATRRRGRAVLELHLDGSVSKKFASVKDAAAVIGSSVSNLYTILREGKRLRNRKYVYDEETVEVKEEHGAQERNSEVPSTKPLTTGCDTCLSAHVLVHTCGRVHPPGDDTQARGTRRVGGMVVAMPSLSDDFATLLEQALKDLYATQLLGLEKCQLDDDQDGVVAQIGYTNLEASRRRCSLSAISVALRILTQLYVLIGKASRAHRSRTSSGGQSCPPTPTHINITTDSGYVYGLLKDTDRVWEWGSALTQEEFVYNGEGSKWFANTDILFSLSRAYYKLVDPQGVMSSLLEANITVNFVLDTRNRTPLKASEFRGKMDSWGKEAAKLFHKRSYPYQGGLAHGDAEDRSLVPTVSRS